jgi:predicted transcriptional regulator
MIKRSFRLPVELDRRLAAHARAHRASQTSVLQAALNMHLSPDSGERLEAALTRRLDRMTRRLEQLEWNSDLANETLAQFIRFWLVSNPPLPDTALKAAQAMGRERWERFVEALSGRMELGPRFRDELSSEMGVGT